MQIGIEYFKLEDNILKPVPGIEFKKNPAGLNHDYVVIILAKLRHMRYEGRGRNVGAFRFVKKTFWGKVVPLTENIYLVGE
jgi:hypothetical protein